MAYIKNQVPTLIDNFGYQTIFSPEMKSGKSFLVKRNAAAFKLSKEMLTSEEVTSLQCNYAPLLLRKKTVLYPEGRTSYKFKQFLRGKVTIYDKNTDMIIEGPGKKAKGKMERRKKKQEEEDPLEPDVAPDQS